jgi:hypothetical protein
MRVRCQYATRTFHTFPVRLLDHHTLVPHRLLPSRTAPRIYLYLSLNLYPSTRARAHTHTHSHTHTHTHTHTHSLTHTHIHTNTHTHTHTHMPSVLVFILASHPLLVSVPQSPPITSPLSFAARDAQAVGVVSGQQIARSLLP